MEDKIFKVFFAVCILIISGLAFTPLNVPNVQINNFDKINHISAFAVLGIIAAIAHKNKPFRIIAIGLTAYGIFIETIQYLIPNRFFSLADIVADLIGILIAYLIIITARKYRPILH